MRSFLPIVVFAAFLTRAVPVVAAVIFVDLDNISGTENGTTWATAYTAVQDAIDNADPGDDIWIAEGTYLETLTVISGVALYGGFDGTETLLSQRDPETELSIVDANNAANAVVLDSVLNTRLDGLTFRGSLNGPSIHCEGVDDSNTIDGCVFRDNVGGSFGGGMALYFSSPTISACLFENNSSNQDGSGIYMNGQLPLGIRSSPHIVDCVFTGNTGTSPFFTIDVISVAFSSAPLIEDCVIAGNEGFAFTVIGDVVPNATIRNCIIVGNGDGAGRFIGTPLVDGCVISGNFVNGGVNAGAISLAGSDDAPTIQNCILSGNESSGVYAEGGADPIIKNCTFVDNGHLIGGGGVFSGKDGFGNGNSDTTITNSIFMGNTGRAVMVDDPTCSALLTNCLFLNNPNGDYMDATFVVRTGAAAINANAPGASGNVDVKPLFIMGPLGRWTAAPSYNASTNRTTLTDSNASFTPGQFQYVLINTDLGQRMQTLIMSNTATTVEVINDVTVYTANGDAYQFIDYHLDYGSGAVDRGIATSAPATDLDGNARPFDVEALGADDTGTEFDIGAFEDPVIEHGIKEFVWGSVTSPKAPDDPFNVSLTAMDLLNTPLTAFTGPIDIGAYPTSGVLNEFRNASGPFFDVPLRAQWPRSRSQFIYLAANVGNIDRIGSLALEVNGPPGQTLTAFTIRIKHTKLKFFPVRTFDGEGWSTVYQSDQSIVAGWNTFTFQNGFYYNGVDNLMVDISFSNASGSTSAGSRGFFGASVNDREISGFSTVAGEHPKNWSGPGNAQGPDDFVPNVRFGGGNEVVLSPSTSGSFSAGAWNGSVTVTHQGNIVLGTTDDFGHSGETNAFNVVDPDSDSDGLLDTWEMAHFGNLAQSANGDSDGDGFNHLAEFTAGTDPANAGDSPTLPSPVWVDFDHAGPELGSSLNPFSTLQEAVNVIPPMDEIRIKGNAGGPSADVFPLTIDFPLILRSDGGAATIGLN